MSSSNQKGPKPIDLYADLPPIKNQRLKLTSLTPFTATYVQAHLTQCPDPASIYASRVHGRQILLENPARESKAKKDRDVKTQRQIRDSKRRAMGVIGKKEAKEKGVWKIHESQTKFSLFVPLHHLWLGYMSELLGLPNPPQLSIVPPTAPSIPNAGNMHAKLVKADFHGSIITVRQSKNPCLVGLSGIVIHESENAFKVVTRNDQLKLLPKQNSIFTFSVPLYSFTTPCPPSPAPTMKTVLEAPHIEFDLHGNQFRFRAAERAGRKFKHKETIEL